MENACFGMHRHPVRDLQDAKPEKAVYGFAKHTTFVPVGAKKMNGGLTMVDFLEFTNVSSGRTVYINRNYITDFSYDPTIDRTVISLPGTENYYSIDGDQTQKILEGNKNE